MPRVSVIVPVYNAQQYLDRCVDSILGQTFQDFELILVDDGSTDGSGLLCDRWSQRDSRIQTVHQNNAGQAAARNRGVEMAQSDWICFVDSDDAIHPALLQTLYDGAVRLNVSISMCAAIEAENIPEGFFSAAVSDTFDCSVMDEQGLLQMYQSREHYYWVVWGKLICREIVEKLPFTPGRIFEDNAVVCRWLNMAGQVAWTAQRLYYYAINPHGTTKSGFQLKQLDYLWALEQKIRFYAEKGYPLMRSRIAHEYIGNGIAMFYKIKEMPEAAQELRELRRNMRSVYRKNRKYLKLSKERKITAYSIMFPLRMRLYWLGKGMLGKIKNILRRN